MNRFLGIALIVLALGIGIIPHYTDCLSQGDVVTLANGKTQPMKCHWSAQAEIAIAAPLGITGVLMIPSRKKENIRNLSILGIGLGALVMAIPTQLIGVCTMPTHICVTTMKPLLLSLGGIVTAASLLGLVMTFRKKSDVI